MTEYDATFFSSLRKQRTDDHAELKASLRPQEVTTPGHEVPVSDLSRRMAVGSMALRALDNGWTVKAGTAEYFTGDHLQANGKVREGKEGTHTWIQGVKGDQMFTFSTGDARANGHRVTVDELKQIIEGE